MKRLQIIIEADLDAELQRLARQEHTSKSALVRRFLRERLLPLPPLSADPVGRMAGADEFEPASVNDILYQEPQG